MVYMVSLHHAVVEICVELPPKLRGQCGSGSCISPTQHSINNYVPAVIFNLLQHSILSKFIYTLKDQ